MRAVGRTYEQTKNHWNALLLQEILKDKDAKAVVLQHPIPRRIREKLV
jgi:hypothetical protein